MSDSSGRATVAAAVMMLAVGAAHGDIIVQEGSLSGGAGGPELIDIVLDQFDESLGELTEVRLDFFSSVIGGGTSNGSGEPTQVFASLTADYSLGGEALGGTEAVIDFVVPNVGPPNSFTLFDNDSDLVGITDPAGLSPWIGTGDVIMTALVEFIVFEDPPNSVQFGAGGSVDYTVTYEFTPIPTPAALGLLACAGLASGRRRRR